MEYLFKSRGKRIRITLQMVLLVLLLSFCLENKAEAKLVPTTDVTVPTMEEWQSRFSYVFEKYLDQDVYLKGLFDKSNFYFNVGKWNVEESVFVLNFNSSRLLNKEVSYFTVYLNSRPIYTASIPSTAEEEITLLIPLPKEGLLQDSVNGITIETYLRGQTTDACVDDSTTSTWMNIYKESKVLLGYRPTTVVTDIAQFYEQFTSIEALSNKESAIGTKKGASDSVLSSLGHALAGIGQNAVLNYQKIQIELIEKEADLLHYPYLIYIDTYQNLPIYLKESMSATQQKYAAEGALVCLLKKDSGKILLVTGSNEKDLLNAGLMLSNAEYMSSLTKTEEKVSEKDDFYTKPYTVEEYLTLSQFGTEVKGNFEQKMSFFIDYPSNRNLAASSQLRLDYRYSENLDFTKSLLTVTIDGIPIGSRRLTQEGANDSQETFEIPADLQVTGEFTVELTFWLYPEDNWCELTPEEVPWAYVADTSMLKWAFTENTDLFFEHYPAPFVKDGVIENVKILLPKEWKETDLKTMAGILLTMGRYQKTNRGKLEVITDPRQEQLIDADIISIGEKGKNPLGDINIQSMGKPGFAELTASTYSDAVHAILKVTGESSIGMLGTLNFLGNTENLWQLKGDVFTTDGKEITYYYNKEPTLIKSHPVNEVSAPKEDSMPIITAVSVIVLLLLAAIMIVVKYGRSRKDEE